MLTILLLVYHLFRPGYSFCRTIHRAIVLDNFLITHPNFGLLNGHIYDLDERSYMMLEQEQGIVFGNPGNSQPPPPMRYTQNMPCI